MTFQPEVPLDPRIPADALLALSLSYAQVIAATEQQIAVYQKLAQQEPNPATRLLYYHSAHGVLSLWGRLVHRGPQTAADSERLQALVDALAP